jgi:hypothetical protein
MTMDIQLANFWVDVSLAVFTFLAIIIALFNQKFWEGWNRPKLKFCLSNNFPYVVQKYSGSRMMIKYFRFVIINEGKSVAKNCRVKLISAEPVGKKLSLPLIEPDSLKWSGAPKDTRFTNDQLQPIHREKLDISPGGWELCDLFRIEVTLLNQIIFMSSGERNIPITDEYIITIEISGDNFKPINLKIKTLIPQTKNYWETEVYWAKDISQ